MPVSREAICSSNPLYIMYSYMYLYIHWNKCDSTTSQALLLLYQVGIYIYILQYAYATRVSPLRGKQVFQNQFRTLKIVFGFLYIRVYYTMHIYFTILYCYLRSMSDRILYRTLHIIYTTFANYKTTKTYIICVHHTHHYIIYYIVQNNTTIVYVLVYIYIYIVYIAFVSRD